MGRKAKYYRRGAQYLALTGESPKGFKDVVFICRIGDSPGDIREEVVDQNRLRDWEEVPSKEVPDDWFAAFGLEKRKEPKPRSPQRDAKPMPQPVSQEWTPIVALMYLALFTTVFLGWLIR